MIELIAEIATSHGGQIALAKEFIDRFADAGADWIKFQYTRVQHLRPSDPQFEWFTKSEFSDEQFAELKAHTERRGSRFLLTVYNYQDVPAVKALGLDAVKIGSGEAHEESLHRAITLGPFRRVIVSGASYPPWDSLRVIARYPAPADYARTLARVPYKHAEGWSDHTIGVSVCEDAIMAGAQLIEKHVQLPNQARPCRPFEATVDEFTQLRRFADDDPDVKFTGRWQYA